jgi:hypothetical protein
MKPLISTKTHGAMDYVAGVLIAASPWIFGFVKLGGAPLFLPLLVGIVQLLMTIFTNYEYGLFKAIPMQVHLIIDILSGFILIACPWVYGFYHFVFLPHLLFGLFTVFSGLFTMHSPLFKIKTFDERGF